jgi:hypothetical protein
LGVLFLLTGGAAAPEVQFTDVTQAVGIDFKHENSATSNKYLIETMGGGVALFDYDNDGLVDIYFVDSLTVDTAKDPKAARSAAMSRCSTSKLTPTTATGSGSKASWCIMRRFMSKYPSQAVALDSSTLNSGKRSEVVKDSGFLIGRGF